MAERHESAVGGNRRGCGEGVVAVSVPVDLPIVGSGGGSVAAIVEAERLETLGQPVGDGEIAVGVETRRM